MTTLLRSFVTLLLTALSITQTLAQVVAPTQGGEVSVVVATATTMELSFGTKGNGEGRVVTVSAVKGGYFSPLLATDNTFYQHSTTFGQGSKLGDGYVVYCGTGHRVTVSGLTPRTMYYISSSEYNRDSTSVRYNNWCASVATSTKSMPATALATVPGTTQALSVYPNPSAGATVQLSLQGYQSEPLALRLLDALGREVFAQIVTPSSADYITPLGLPASLATGSYLLLATGKTSQTRQRIVLSN